MTDLTERRDAPGSEAFATDSQYLYFTWEEDIGDIWVRDVTWDDGAGN